MTNKDFKKLYFEAAKDMGLYQEDAQDLWDKHREGKQNHPF